MADKQISELQEALEVADNTLIPVYVPGSATPAQRMTGAQFRMFAVDAAQGQAEKAEAAATEAEAAKEAAVLAREGIEQYVTDAQTAANSAEEAQVAAETAGAGAEAALADVQAAKNAVDITKDDIDSTALRVSADKEAAETAKTAAETAQKASETAQAAAEGSSMSAAEKATEASENADAAALDAQAAENARAAIENMLVEAVSLDSGQPATVSKELVDGVVKLVFGLPAGDQGIQGIAGPAGPQGPAGAPGKDGTSLYIEDIYSTLAALRNAIPTGNEKMYMVEENKECYIWSETSGDWVSAGNLQGPEGPQGPAGVSGKDGKSAYQSAVDAGYAGTETAFNAALSNFPGHLANKSNPHVVTKAQVGLGNVPNVATNDQTPTYTAASTLATLTSGEKLSVSMGKIMKAITDLISHIGNKNNPHGVTATQVGLGNVNNTADSAKPVSTAQAKAIEDAVSAHNTSTAAHADIRQALDAKQDALSGAEGQLVGFDADGKPTAQDSWQSNRNLLDNWYFRNPVNQRGKTSTNTDGYFLDRWICFDLMNSATVSLDNNSIAISATANGSNTVPRIAQRFENPSTYGSKTITFSMKYKLRGKGSIWAEDLAESQNRWLYQELPASQDWKLFKFTFATRSDITKLQISISLGTITVNSESSVSNDTLTEDSTLEIEAVKMEIGDRQTLAHQDADGSWVLNEIPNYAEELAKCQRYFVRIYGRCPAKNTSAQVTNQNGGFISFPVMMRTNPSGSFAEKEMSTLTLGIITANGFEIGGADNYTRGFTADFTADL